MIITFYAIHTTQTFHTDITFTTALMACLGSFGKVNTIRDGLMASFSTLLSAVDTHDCTECILA